MTWICLSGGLCSRNAFVNTTLIADVIITMGSSMARPTHLLKTNTSPLSVVTASGLHSIQGLGAGVLNGTVGTTAVGRVAVSRSPTITLTYYTVTS